MSFHSYKNFIVFVEAKSRIVLKIDQRESGDNFIFKNKICSKCSRNKEVTMFVWLYLIDKERKELTFQNACTQNAEKPIIS